MYWVVKTMANADNRGPGGFYRRAQKIAGPFEATFPANLSKSQLDQEKQKTAANASLPSEVRKQAFETVYIVWSDEEIAEMRARGCEIS